MYKGKRAWAGLAAYTALYIVGFAVCYAGIFLSGHSPIWQVDGLMQHYPFMVYIGDWLRQSVQALLTGGGVKMFDFALGFGEDVLVTMNYYGLGDPLLMLVSALFSGAATEAGYLLLIALRGWCAGMACMALARYKGFDGRQALYSGLMYALSLGLFSAAQIRQLMFANPYIHLPLMLLGMERVFDRKKPWVLSLAVALSALCGFYFLYCNSLLLLIYAVVRQLTRRTEKPLRTLPTTAVRALGWYMLGLGLAAAVFLPATMGFLKGQRLSGGMNLAEMHLTYSIWEYLTFPLSLISSRTTGAVQFMPVLSLFSAALLVLRHRREDRSWLAVTAAAVVMMLVPATGWALNGFSYEATRWSYALSLLAALLGGRMLPELLRMTRREKIVMGAFALAVLAYLALISRTKLAGEGSDAVDAIIWLVVTAACLSSLMCAKGRVLRRVCAGALAAAVLLNVGTAHLRIWQRRESDMVASGESWAQLSGSAFANLPETDSFGRTDADLAVTQSMINGGALASEASTAVYNSTISGNVHGMMADVANAGLLQINAIAGLDDRAALEAIWSVNRQLSPDDGTSRIPYGFERTGTTGSGLAIDENTLALPIGYAMTAAMSVADYAALSPLEKQWALVQCAVTDESSLPEAEVSQSAAEIAILDVQMENVAVDGDEMTVGEDAVIRLIFDAPADCELYLELEGFAFRDGEIDLGNLVHFSCGGATASVNLMPEGFELDLLDRGSYLVNLGYGAEARTSAEIRFARTGVYRLSGMRLHIQPMEHFSGMIERLRERGLRDAVVETNRVTGRIALEEPSVLVFSIPASDGWTARVDGKTVRTIASADALLAVELTAGAHEIELTYRTPWLLSGAAVSATSLLALAGIILAGRCKARKETGNESV